MQLGVRCNQEIGLAFAFTGLACGNVFEQGKGTCMSSPFGISDAQWMECFERLEGHV